MADKEYTYAEVLEHNTKKDLFVVVHDKVYNASSFVDEHPYVPRFSCRLHPQGSERTTMCPLNRITVPRIIIERARVGAKNATWADFFCAVVARKSFSTSAARTQQKLSRT
ncbi:hypothetical protein P280DRAFT_468758 [Massarina eburnea CBS 473.64]|uniref:Cytochrome b5 heme-binding domain-containing protein n=1 Tax=Massarina eburnea CBS 473.64 TaxID=1395130 RepID=A0A6A6S165_9PLEO|nr:hypothetical protein P280DRAFT_468758 [Massarina eburnea CBS 473.64]